MGFVSNKQFYNSKIKKIFLNNNTLNNTFFISNEKRNEKLISLKIKNLSPDYLISIQHKWILSNKNPTRVQKSMIVVFFRIYVQVKRLMAISKGRKGRIYIKHIEYF